MILREAKKIKQYRNFRDYHLEQLRDPEDARLYLEIAQEEYEKDGDVEAYMLALRDIATAQGGLGRLAKETQLNRQNLYKALSDNGNPRVKTLEKILNKLGLCLSFEPLKNAAA